MVFMMVSLIWCICSGAARGRHSDNSPDTLDGVVDNKGFTGHETLEKRDLVHMNGRVYDPLVARFLSADLFIQDPYNGQNYSRYIRFGNPNGGKQVYSWDNARRDRSLGAGATRPPYLARATLGLFRRLSAGLVASILAEDCTPYTGASSNHPRAHHDRVRFSVHKSKYLPIAATGSGGANQLVWARAQFFDFQPGLVSLPQHGLPDRHAAGGPAADRVGRRPGSAGRPRLGRRSAGGRRLLRACRLADLAGSGMGGLGAQTGMGRSGGAVHHVHGPAVGHSGKPCNLFPAQNPV